MYTDLGALDLERARTRVFASQILKNCVGIQVHGAVYVIDAADKERLEEAKTELLQMLRDDHVAGKPILIFANKQVCLPSHSEPKPCFCYLPI